MCGEVRGEREQARGDFRGGEPLLLFTSPAFSVGAADITDASPADLVRSDASMALNRPCEAHGSASGSSSELPVHKEMAGDSSFQTSHHVHARSVFLRTLILDAVLGARL